MKYFAAAIAALGFTLCAQAKGFATAQDAIALVHKAIQHINTVGKDKAYSDFTAKNPEFIDRDAYVVVYDMDGKVLAHGQNANMVGKALIDHKDVDGKEFVKERVAMAKAAPSFWQDYKFVDPVTKKILPKSTYCERADDTVVCAGIYKR